MEINKEIKTKSTITLELNSRGKDFFMEPIYLFYIKDSSF